MSSLLFTFQDAAERDEFLGVLYQAKEDAAQSETAAAIQAALDTMVLDPTVVDPDQRPVALFVSGQKIKEGPYNTISKDFSQQMIGHKAHVEIKEMREGKWHTVRRRQRQQ